jgi:hypothetical protein
MPLLDLLEPSDGRAVEAEPLLEDLLAQLVKGDREVLHEAGKVAESDIEELGVVLLPELQRVRWTCHESPLSCDDLVHSGRKY